MNRTKLIQVIGALVIVVCMVVFYSVKKDVGQTSQQPVTSTIDDEAALKGLKIE